MPDTKIDLLHELMDRSGTIIGVIDEDGILIECNDTLCRNAGRPRDQLVGRSVLRLHVNFPVQTPEQWKDLMRRVGAQRELAIETELGKGDGSTYRARLTLSIESSAGKTYMLVVGHRLPDSAPVEAEMERDARWRRALLQMATHDSVSAGDLPKAAAFIQNQVCEVLPASSAIIWRKRPHWTTVTGIATAASPEGRLWLERAIDSGDVCDAIESCVTSENRVEARKWILEHGGGAQLIAPIRCRGEVWGALIITSFRQRRWSGDETAFAAEAAGEVTHAILNWERNQMEASLAASNERYRMFFEMSQEFVWCGEFHPPIPLDGTFDEQVDLILERGTVSDCNDAMADFFAVDPVEMRGMPIRKLLEPIDAERRAELRILAASSYRVTNLRVKHIVAGKEFWILRTTQGVFQNGQLARLWGAGRDITGLTHAEERLVTSEQRYRAFVANSSEGIYRIEYQEPIPIDLPAEEMVQRIWEFGIMAECNQAMASLRGYRSPEEMVGRSARDFRLGTREEWQQALDFVRSGFRMGGFERPVRLPSGETRWLRYSALGVVDNRCLTRLWGTISDVTGRIQLEQELRQLSARNVSLLEQERARVAREIHDELGQQLTVLKFEAAAWESGMRTPPPGSLTQAIDAAIQSVRRIATELRPAILDQFGLGAALEWQAGEFSRRTTIATKCEIDDDIQVNAELAITVFRIVQEALTNVARHSGANLATIHLSQVGQHLGLDIRDNGCGFSTPAAGATSLGLVGIRERAREIGGIATVTTQPGEGTVISAVFPLTPRSELP